MQQQSFYLMTLVHLVSEEMEKSCFHLFYVNRGFAKIFFSDEVALTLFLFFPTFD